jgi:hypothetical protein
MHAALWYRRKRQKPIIGVSTGKIGEGMNSHLISYGTAESGRCSPILEWNK